MSNIILNVDKATNKITGFARDITLAEYFENYQLLPLNFLVPILDESGNYLSNTQVNAEIPIIGQLYQKNETIIDTNVVLILNEGVDVSSEVSIKIPKTLFEVLEETEDKSSVGIASTDQTLKDIMNIYIGDYTFEVNTKETYTNFYKDEVVKAFESESNVFSTIVNRKYFENDDLYNVRNIMDHGYYSNGEINLLSGEN